MGKLLLSTAIGLTMAVSLGATGYAASAKLPATTSASRPTNLRPLPAGEHRIKATVLKSGYYGSSGSGATLLDTETVTCSSTTTCTFAMSAMVQACTFGNGTNPDIAIQAVVDGVYVDGGPYAGQNTANICQIDNWQGVYAVSPGAHTVQYYAYNSSLSLIAQWSDRTDVTKP
jgi:hypothetical protein